MSASLIHCHHCGKAGVAGSLCEDCEHLVGCHVGAPECGKCQQREPARTNPAQDEAGHGAARARSVGASGDQGGGGGVTVPEVEARDENEGRDKDQRFFLLRVAAVVLICCTVMPLLIAWRACYMPRHKSVALRLHSCETVGADLLRELAKGFFKREGVKEKDIKVEEGQGDPGGLRLTAFIPKDTAEMSMEILLHKDSAEAFSSMRDKACEMAVLWRKMSSEENIEMKRNGLGDMLTDKNECLLAQDNIAVVVNGGNQLTSLPKDRLKDIFAGDTELWDQLQLTAGPAMSGPIKIYVPSEQSEIYKSFCEALGIKGVKRTAEVNFLDNYASVSDAVYQDRNAIGFVNVPNVRSAKRIEILGDGGGRAAEAGGGAYLDFTRPVYLYKTAKANEYADRFKSFILSAEGRQVILNAKLDPRTPEEVAAAAPEPPALYKKLTEKAARLEDFACLFDEGKAVVKKPCAESIGRLVESLRNPKNMGRKRVMVFGFADSTGEDDPNRTLSLNRAREVAAKMAGRVEVVNAEGFGSSLPVSSNGTPEGRERNRRVEVWLLP